jgi:DNA polymerase sigma
MAVAINSSFQMREKVAAHLKTFRKALGKQVQLINVEVIRNARVPIMKATFWVPLGTGWGEAAGGPKVPLQVDVCIGNTNGAYGVLYVQRQVRRWRGGQGARHCKMYRGFE